MKDIEEKILKIAEKYSRKDSNIITLDSNFKTDLNFDSLSLTEFVLACEDEFQIEIDLDHEDTAKATVIRDLYNAVLVLISSK